ATLKHRQQGAPAFAWYFRWQSPMLEDAGAWHTAELAFCFDNTARCAQGTGNGPEALALAKKMATAWANFARTGNPSQPGCRGRRSRRIDAQRWCSTTHARSSTTPNEKRAPLCPADSAMTKGLMSLSILETANTDQTRRECAPGE